MRYGRKNDLFVVQPGDRGRTGTRRRLLVRLRRETTTTSSLAWCLIGQQSSWLLASLFLWVFPSSPFPSTRTPLERGSRIHVLSLSQVLLLLLLLVLIISPALFSSYDCPRYFLLALSHSHGRTRLTVESLCAPSQWAQRLEPIFPTRLAWRPV